MAADLHPPADSVVVAGIVAHRAQTRGQGPTVGTHPLAGHHLPISARRRWHMAVGRAVTRASLLGSRTAHLAAHCYAAGAVPDPRRTAVASGSCGRGSSARRRWHRTTSKWADWSLRGLAHSSAPSPSRSTRDRRPASAVVAPARTGAVCRPSWSGGGVVLVGMVALAVILGGGACRASAWRPPTASAMITDGPPPTRVGRATATSRCRWSTPISADGRAGAPSSTTARHRTRLGGARPRRCPLRRYDRDPTATIEPTPTPEIARKYTVKPGDTIRSIASKFGLKPRDLRAVNDIGEDVQVGQRLRIPARSVPGRRLERVEPRVLPQPAPVTAGRSGTSWSRTRRARSR